MLYTRKGDGGTTKLYNSEKGVRASKSSLIFDTLGTVDELNSSIGFCKALSIQKDHYIDFSSKKESFATTLENIQQILFSLQAELGGADVKVKEDHTIYLEEIVGACENNFPPITTFIVPGGSPSGAYLDVSRTIARRAERLIVKVKEEDDHKVGEDALKFINRLSSALYALARLSNHLDGFKENNPKYE